jgi:glycosyltransferase involved in cell wall biosynthesis
MSEQLLNRGGRLLKTSVAMCTYNGALYLPEQLGSIARQTQQPGELIVCDDGSTDETIALISEFSRTAAFPVRLFCNREKLGPAKNFEKAIGLCEGQIIFLCDQDDVWQPEKIERLWKVFESHPEAYYAFSDAQTIGQEGELLEQTTWEALRLRPSDFAGAKQVEMLLKENVITGAGLAFRSSFREIALPIPSGWMHDYWIGLLGSAISDGIPVPEPLYKYRRHAAQVCGWRQKTFIQYCMISLASDEEILQDKLRVFQKLTERLQSVASFRKSPADRMELLKQKEIHLQQRATARSSKGFSRIGRVLEEALSGRYRRFSDPYYSIVRDLIAG